MLGADLGRTRSEAEALQVPPVLPGDARRIVKLDTSVISCVRVQGVCWPTQHEFCKCPLSVGAAAFCGCSRLEATAHDIEGPDT